MEKVVPLEKPKDMTEGEQELWDHVSRLTEEIIELSARQDALQKTCHRLVRLTATR